METKNIINDKDKHINSYCVCKEQLYWKKGEVIMLNPCEHLVHTNCYFKNKLSCCPYCHNCIDSITKLHDYKKNPKAFQKCVDILSVTNVDDMVEISYDNALINMPEILGIISKGALNTGMQTGWEITRDFLKGANVKIKVSGLEKIKPGPKVYIANHQLHLDFVCLLYILKTGFAASSFINENPFTKKLLDIIPVFVINTNSNKSENAVDGMRKYVEKYGSICLFPEGMLSHPATLTRFRSGAFHIGYPVYPIVLKYKNYLSDTSFLNFFLKGVSDLSEHVELIVMDPFYPPFNDEKIELVRFAMAEQGGLLLSRVSNKK